MSHHEERTPAPDPGVTEEPGRERSERPGSEGALGSGAAAPPGGPVLVVANPEVPEKARRRQFSAEYKLRILEEADACSEPGEIGGLLRREGLYSSHLTTWRRQREEGALRGLAPRTRGRKPKPKNPLAGRLAELERENRALQERVRQAEMIIEVQKKVSQILGGPLRDPESTEDGS